MRPIPPKLRKELSEDPFMAQCIICGDRKVEWDHVWVYARRQINERWSIVPLCYTHHRGGKLNREYTQYISLQRATDQELSKYPKVNWKQLKQYLEAKYGSSGSTRST